MCDILSKVVKTTRHSKQSIHSHLTAIGLVRVNSLIELI